ncbi:PocR ligand-binding domain-containing protein [Aneurinibacillus soli]|uniref:PocR ligand-binding domain-containing protein n=1 Tax=Aneurinibacillus soli TaxID=1500254 RepID=UPI00155FF2F9|nr:PocR ligand-binding domain-containing protein [Aneurinibacillus soli]
MKYKFSDLVDITKLQKLMKHFYHLTNISHGLIDPEGNILSAIGWQDICIKFHRAHPHSGQRCKESDLSIQERLHLSQEYGSYICQNGLVESFIPIIIEGEHLATLILGQFFYEEPDINYFRRQAREFGFSEENYLNALSEVPIISPKEVDACMKYFVHLAEMLADMGLTHLKQRQAEESLRKTNQHLDSLVKQRTKELAEANQELQKDIQKRKQTEIKLRDSEERLRLMLQNMPVMMKAYDEQGNIAVWNRECELVTGYSQEEMIGNPNALTWLYPDETYFHHVNTEWMEQGNDFRDWEKTLTCKDGTEKTISWFSISGRFPVPGWGFWAIGVDITQRKQTERQLRKTASELKAIFQALPDLYFRLDKDGTIIHSQARDPNDFYVSPEEFIGKKFRDILPSETGFQLQQASDYAIETNSLACVEYSLPMKQEMHYFEARFLPLLESQLMVIVRTITDRKRVEQALLEERNFINTILDTVDTLVLAMDRHGRIVHFNCACEKLSGYSFHEVQGTFVWEQLLLPEDVQTVRELFQDLSIEKVDLHKENMWRTKDGRHRLISWSNSILLDSEGQIKYVIGTGIDSTDRRRTEELLRKSDRLAAVGQLAAGVAHEVRNPLTVLKGFTQLLKNGFTEYENYLTLMESEVERIELIISEFLTLAKPEVMNVQKKDLGAFLQQVVDLMNTKAILNSIQITLKIDQELSPITCDENQLKQVFINTLQNAIEAMPHGGNIFIFVEKYDYEQVQIRIIDEGCGIPQERIPRLGEPFYSTKEKGTGLGLMVSYKIIERHEGSFFIHSELNKGTTVTILLPIELVGARQYIQ